MPEVKISEGLLGLLTTILGAVIAIVSVAYNSHFKAQEEAATARVAQAIRQEDCASDIVEADYTADDEASAANPKKV